VSGGQYVAAAYGAFLVFVVVYVAIIAAKLARLQRETDELRAGRAEGYPSAVREEREPTERGE
jgi:type II secretory pathway component PulM